MPVVEVQYLTKRPVRSAPGATNQACIVIRDFGHEVLRVQAEARVRAAFCAARLRPTGPLCELLSPRPFANSVCRGSARCFAPAGEALPWMLPIGPRV